MRTLTDYSGRASVNAVSPIEAGSFQIDVEVSYRGQTGKAAIRQTNFPTSPTRRPAGREPGKSTNPNAQTASTTTSTATGAATAATTGVTTTTTATTAATGAAVSAGGGDVEACAVIGLVAGGAGGAGAAVIALSRKEAPTGPAGRRSAPSHPRRPSASPGGSGVLFWSRPPDSTPVQSPTVGSSATARVDRAGATSHLQVAGTFVVVLTVNDARQSVRAETSSPFFTVDRTWRTPSGDFT